MQENSSSLKSQRCAELGVATIYEAAGQKGWVQGLRRIAGGSVSGPVATVACAPYDNLGLIHALATAKPGEILVMVGLDPTILHTFMGDVIATQAKARGVVGLVVDGYVRDVDALQEIDLAVWSRGVAPYGPRKAGPFSLGTSVTVSGVQIEPGDQMVLDGDGAVVVPQKVLEEVLIGAEERAAREAGMRERLVRGELLIDIAGLR